MQVGPIISGAMAEAVGWRNFWWLYVAMLVLSLVMVIFMFPETKYHRLHPDEIGHGTAPSYYNSNEKLGGADGKEVIANDLAPVATAQRDPYLGRGKPSKAQWGLFTPNPEPFKSLLIDFWTPWKLFAFPIVQFASFVVSWSCSSFLTLNLTQDQAFGYPPYNKSSGTIGTYIHIYATACV